MLAVSAVATKPVVDVASMAPRLHVSMEGCHSEEDRPSKCGWEVAVSLITLELAQLRVQGVPEPVAEEIEG